MARRIVILHGWSDTSETFHPLAALLRRHLGRDVAVIALGDYVSMDEDVRFEDLAAAMDRAWDQHGLPRSARSVDALVHSTGALVLRDWLRRTFPRGACPVKHLVMLAPANFGSPIAHKGRSLMGRLVKGFNKDGGGAAFHTGRRILKGLELASPYTWRLAERDRFGEAGKRYDVGGILCTVLVGSTGYSGIRAVANSDGSDGTVRVSTANMNCVSIRATYPTNPTPQENDVKYVLEASSGRTAFGLLPRHNHSTITLAHCDGRSLARVRRTKRDGELLGLIFDALTVEDDGFHAWCDRLDALTAAATATRPGKTSRHAFQNTLVRLQDQFGDGVRDYVIEIYEDADESNEGLSRFFYDSALANVHPHSDDPSYRSLYIDCTQLYANLDKVHERISISVTAYPQLEEGRQVGYLTLGVDEIGGLRIPNAQIQDVFEPHRTALVTLTIERHQAPSLFRFRDYGERS